MTNLDNPTAQKHYLGAVLCRTLLEESHYVDRNIHNPDAGRIIPTITE